MQEKLNLHYLGFFGCVRGHAKYPKSVFYCVCRMHSQQIAWDGFAASTNMNIME